MQKIYYNRDASLKYLKDKTVGIIGYGIQGRAQALNIRDSGIDVLVANRKDRYVKQAVRDGFRVYKISEAVKKSDTLIFLIPDQAQPEVYKRHIKDCLRPDSMLVFAHGYTPRFKTVDFSSDIDVAMLAPRMPGHQIREYFLRRGGVPAFFDVIQDKTGLAGKKVLALAKAAGFTRAGVLRVSYKEEADLDLFTEQFLIAGIVAAIYAGFEVLTKEYSYSAVPALMELYASGELAEVLKLASKMGIGRVFQKNASPTCQFGIASEFNKALARGIKNEARSILKRIQNSSFNKQLDREGNSGYPSVRKLWEGVNNSGIEETQRWINKFVKMD